MGWYASYYIGPYAEVTVKMVVIRRDGCKVALEQKGRRPKWTWIDDRDGWLCVTCGTEGGRDYAKKPTSCKCTEGCDDPEAEFCSKCGLKTSERFSEQREPKFHCHEGRELSNEALASINDHIETAPDDEGFVRYQFIPNQRREGDPSFQPQEGGGAYDLSDVNRGKEMDWLRFTFGAELAKLEGHYGNLEIKWGIIFWGG